MSANSSAASTQPDLLGLICIKCTDKCYSQKEQAYVVSHMWLVHRKTLEYHSDSSTYLHQSTDMAIDGVLGGQIEVFFSEQQALSLPFWIRIPNRRVMNS